MTNFSGDIELISHILKGIGPKNSDEIVKILDDSRVNAVDAVLIIRNVLKIDLGLARQVYFSQMIIKMGRALNE